MLLPVRPGPRCRRNSDGLALGNGQAAAALQGRGEHGAGRLNIFSIFIFFAGNQLLSSGRHAQQDVRPGQPADGDAGGAAGAPGGSGEAVIGVRR